MSGPFAGATIPPADYGGTQLAGSQQFDSYVGVGLALASQKVYFNNAQYPATVPTRYQQLLSAGVQLVLCYRPPFAGLPGTTYPADKSQLNASVAAFVAAASAAGAPPPKVVPWQEPQNGSNSMSAAQCLQMFTYYTAGIRSAGAKVIYDTATHGGSALALSYYPGASLCDEILADFYGDTYHGGVRLDGPGSLIAQANADGKPFGWGELGSALSASSVPTPAQVRAYWNYVVAIIAAQIAAGLASDSMWYNGVTSNWNTILSSADFRVPLLVTLWQAYQQSGPPPPPPVPQPQVASSATFVTYGPPGALDAVLAAADDGQGSRWPAPLARQNHAFDPLLWSALMPNPQVIPATLYLQANPPLNIPGGQAGTYLGSDNSGNITLLPGPGQLTPVTVQTSAYPANPGDWVPCNATSAFTVTLPAAPANLTVIAAEVVAGTHTITVAASGTDVFNVAAGATSLSLTAVGQWVSLLYAAGPGIWYVLSGGTGGTVTSVTAGDASISVGGTATAPAIAAGTLDQIASLHPPAANVPMNSKKLTGLAAGSAATDSAQYGQTLAGGDGAPMTTLGDTLYQGASAPARLAGNTTATKNFYTQTGTGSVSAAPAWGTIASGDLPAGTTSAKGALQLDGTASDILGDGAQAAGANGLAADSGHVHPTVLTTLGDMPYASAANTPHRLAGNTTATKNFLTQTGTGSVSAAPAWGAIASGDLPAATTGLQGAVILDGTATDIQPAGNQAAGASTKAAAGNHVHPDNLGWLAADNGWLIANGDYAYGQTVTPVAGTVYLMKLMVRYALTLTNLIFDVQQAASGTSTGSFVGLYSSAGSKLTGSSDIASAFTATGAASCALTTAQALTAGTFVWAALLLNIPTLPILMRFINTAPSANPGLTAATYRWATAGTGQSTLPASITPSSNVATAVTLFVAGD